MSIEKLLHAPSFVLSTIVLYWSLPLGALFQFVKVFQFKGSRNDMYTWASFMLSCFGVRFVKVGNESLYKPATGSKVIYLCNHRSWADFFCDVYLTQGNAALLSRMLVLYVFPFFMTSVVILKGVVLFKRGKIEDKEAFNAWLTGKLAASPIPGLLVYPEGTRSIREESLPLKRGMLYYAHSRGITVQIVMSAGKDYVLSEKRIRARIGRTIVTTYSPPINPGDFPDVSAFLNEVQKQWDQLWAMVFQADVDKLPVLSNEDVVMHDYPDSMRWQQLALTMVSGLGMLIWALFTWRVVDALLGLLGPLKQAAQMLLFTWIAASLVSSLLGPRYEPKPLLPVAPALAPPEATPST